MALSSSPEHVVEIALQSPPQLSGSPRPQGASLASVEGYDSGSTDAFDSDSEGDEGETSEEEEDLQVVQAQTQLLQQWMDRVRSQQRCLERLREMLVTSHPLRPNNGNVGGSGDNISEGGRGGGAFVVEAASEAVSSVLSSSADSLAAPTSNVLLLRDCIEKAQFAPQMANARKVVDDVTSAMSHRLVDRRSSRQLQRSTSIAFPANTEIRMGRRELRREARRLSNAILELGELVADYDE